MANPPSSQSRGKAKAPPQKGTLGKTSSIGSTRAPAIPTLGPPQALPARPQMQQPPSFAQAGAMPMRQPGAGQAAKKKSPSKPKAKGAAPRAKAKTPTKPRVPSAPPMPPTTLGSPSAPTQPSFLPPPRPMNMPNLGMGHMSNARNPLGQGSVGAGMSEAKDRKLDKQQGVKQGSKKDNALDRKRGVPVRKK